MDTKSFRNCWIVGGLTLAFPLAGALGCSAASDEAVGDTEPYDTAAQPLRNAAAQGFAWVNQHSGTLSNQFLFNSKGGSISVTKQATGVFTVTFARLGSTVVSGLIDGVAHAVAYGTDNVRCGPTGFGTPLGTTDAFVQVRCDDPAGNPRDSFFVVQYGRADEAGQNTSNGGVGAYVSLLNKQGEIVSSWNSTSGINRVSRAATGVYDVSLPGLAAFGGNVQVSTGMFIPGVHCKVQNWGPSGSEQRVRVLCFKGTTPTDSIFSLTYAGPGQASVFDQGAFAWANDATSASYQPSSLFSFNSGNTTCSGNGSNSAGRPRDPSGNLFVGRYFMRHTLLGATQSAVHVTAYGNNANYCKVRGWGASGNGTQVDVGCFNSAGNPANSQYVETYSRSLVRGPC